MSSILSTLGDAAEVIGGRADGAAVLTCDHASERLPSRWRWPDADERLRGTHWTHDLGAEELTRELADRCAIPAVLSRFTRLLCDPNRPEDSDTLFRDDAEGAPVALNSELTQDDQHRRLHGYHRPYHVAVHSTVGASLSPIVFALHSFTPTYDGDSRPMEVGVVWNREDKLGQQLLEHLNALKFEAHGNEPYSGKDGFMYVADRHADWHGRRALELEVRQDLCVDAGFRRRLVNALADFLAAF